MVEAVYSVSLGIRSYLHSLSGKHFHSSIPRFIKYPVCVSVISVWKRKRKRKGLLMSELKKMSPVEIQQQFNHGHSINHKSWSTFYLSFIFCCYKCVWWVSWWFAVLLHVKHSKRDAPPPSCAMSFRLLDRTTNHLINYRRLHATTQSSQKDSQI